MKLIVVDDSKGMEIAHHVAQIIAAHPTHQSIEIIPVQDLEQIKKQENLSSYALKNIPIAPLPAMVLKSGNYEFESGQDKRRKRREKERKNRNY